MIYLKETGSDLVRQNTFTMTVGYKLATLSQLDRPRAKSITVEVGIQNGTLAITIASRERCLYSKGEILVGKEI